MQQLEFSDIQLSVYTCSCFVSVCPFVALLKATEIRTWLFMVDTKKRSFLSSCLIGLEPARPDQANLNDHQCSRARVRSPVFTSDNDVIPNFGDWLSGSFSGYSGLRLPLLGT